METVKQYYQDSYLKETETRVVKVREENDGLQLLLEETVFYPGGGGQSIDKGTINGFKVEKITSEDGELWHHLPVGAKIERDLPVLLKIDWSYRYYNMQQHSGQHLISYVLYKYGLQTVSVHLGEEYTLIEVESDSPQEVLFDEVEMECNRLINAALPIKTHWITRDEVDRYPLRRAAGDWEKLRIVEIDKIDYSACGGTHVKNSAEIGLIKIIGKEKIRGHIRIKALIGEKAYTYFNQIYNIVETLKTELPADLQNIVSRTRQLKDDIRDLKKEKKHYQSLYINDLCRSLSSKKDDVILYHLQEGAADDMQILAGCIKKRNDLNVFIVSKKRFCFVATEDYKELTADFLKAGREIFSVKGGGSPGFIQGTIGKYDKTALTEVLKELTAGIKNKLELA